MVNRKIVKFLSLRYKILAFIFILLAAGLVLLPKIDKHDGIKPELLLSNAISPERYISTDELAAKIINQDPSVLLVDVRDSVSYHTFSLTGAVNIPITNLFDEEFETYLNQDAYDVILFSNDNLLADQAWILCRRLGYVNLHVLNGGINEWYSTIINPEKPTEQSSSVEIDLYAKRKASSMYFGVAYPEPVKKKPVIVKPKPVIKVVPKKKKKKMPIEGGC